ncbi:hypothetical protein Pcinc_040754 [Petrolisthes cinctipes]|uniref:Nidogen n=1 Tax=Petrolisthes cinctipes TaxID=88211 RepID=A0AAE1BNK2_PETCI|nr:hypothetical protein Pcinc_040754 [Petrolisthes cinctipes]
MRCSSLLLVVLGLGLLAGPSLAASKTYFYNYGEEAGDTSLPDGDEIASPEISLRAPIIFFGQIYNTIFVNSNGFVSFLTEIPNFFNVQFPLEYPVIAPFYSDVDTTEAGKVWYRETSDPATVSRAKFDIQEHFSGMEEFDPTGIFIVTWDGVGPYSQRSDRVNTYQLVILTDSEDSYAIFHYADGGLQWLQGDGKNPSLPDARGQAGIMSGDGRSFILEHSGMDQVRSLDKLSNCGSPGVWMYRIGQLTTNENVQEPSQGGQEEGEGQEVVTEGESCAVGGSVCHSNGVCNDYTPGFCCSCDEEYFGNGINCVRKEEPIRITGKMMGNINGVDIEDSNFHVYVLTNEGRSYTALSNIPSQIGYDIQSVLAIGTGIGWLFAKPIKNVPNGFTLTGGVLNRTVDINFPQTGHNIVVQQHFLGLDVFNYLEVKSQVTGSVPTVPLGSKIEMDAFNEEYTKVKSGQLRSRSSRVFRLKGQTIDTPFTVETTIDFNECTWRPRDLAGPDTLRLKVAENIFIQYDGPEEIVRYALSAKVSPLEEVDPCVEGHHECGENSQCVVDGDSFRCVCERGYSEVYDATLNKGICLDMNECDTGRDNCHPSATCVNTPGSFTCSCKPGFTGNGVYCEKMGICDGQPCDPNAGCKDVAGTAQCTCLPGYVGDGYKCTEESETVGILEQRSCIDYDICSHYANCEYDDAVRSFRCVCHTGYNGDGQTCTPTDEVNCGTAQNCSPYGECVNTEEGFRCQCMPGFTGDGYTCEVDTSVQQYNYSQPYQPPDEPYYPPEQPYYPPEQQPYYPPEEGVDPYQQPQQPYYPPVEGQDLGQDIEEPYYPPNQPYPSVEEDRQYPPSHEWRDVECLFGVCFCPPNYFHDTNLNKCIPTSSNPEHTEDIVVPYCGSAKCTCPTGYIYNEAFNSCDLETGELVRPVRPEARPLPACFEGSCFCPNGYTYSYDRHDCEASGDPEYNYNIQGGGTKSRVSCNEVNNCHHNAQCIYDSYSQTHSCQCNAGYDGDGFYCNELDVSCDKVDICHIHAQCVFDDRTLKHVCVCSAGYQGDGLVCLPQDECSSVSDCDANAQCQYDGASQRYRCVCNIGFTGDGRSCTPVREAGCNIVNRCDVNADCIYDTYALEHRCQCRDGFEGDGTLCTPTQIGCNVVYNCGENAECSYDQTARGYRCRCRERFQGDGFFCRSSVSCRSDPSVCHPQASCERDPASPFGASCKCRAGFTGDGYNCIEAPDHEKNLLLVNQGLAVLRMPLDARSGPGFIIHFEAFMTAVGADVDCLAGRYYWTDVRSATIRSSNYDGSQRKPVVSKDIGFPEDVAVDWVSGNVYWTDSSRDVVAVASVDSGVVRVVINESLVNPRGLAIHPGLGLLFWSDWNRLGPKIEVSGLDGSGRRVLVDENISLPNSLVVDYETVTLCWADAGTHSIECVGMDGTGRRVVMEGALYPFGLTIADRNFLFTDWNDTKLHTVDRYSGLEAPSRVPPLGGSGKLYGVVAVPETCPPVSNVCGVSDGGCPPSHLCLPNGRGGRTCACSDEELLDGSCSDISY